MLLYTLVIAPIINGRKVLAHSFAPVVNTANRAKYNYLLSGLIYCGECGATMLGKTVTSYKPSYREYLYYMCGTQSRKEKSSDVWIYYIRKSKKVWLTNTILSV